MTVTLPLLPGRAATDTADERWITAAPPKKMDEWEITRKRILESMLDSIYTPSPAIEKLSEAAERQEKDKLNGRSS